MNEMVSNRVSAQWTSPMEFGPLSKKETLEYDEWVQEGNPALKYMHVICIMGLVVPTYLIPLNSYVSTLYIYLTLTIVEAILIGFLPGVFYMKLGRMTIFLCLNMSGVAYFQGLFNLTRFFLVLALIMFTLLYKCAESRACYYWNQIFPLELWILGGTLKSYRRIIPVHALYIIYFHFLNSDYIITILYCILCLYHLCYPTSLPFSSWITLSEKDKEEMKEYESNENENENEKEKDTYYYYYQSMVFALTLLMGPGPLFTYYALSYVFGIYQPKT